MNHTPGPWIAYDEQLLTSEGGFIARFSSANYPHQNNANARLAAAAPELLESLEALFGYISEGFLVRNISTDKDPDFALRMLPFVMDLKKAEAAIQKAKEVQG